MTNDDIRAKVAELRNQQRAIQTASAAQATGWRQQVVTGRRNIGVALGDLSALIAGRPAVGGLDSFRRAVSSLRAALAEHQALWPAITIDPADPAYVASVKRVRTSYEVLDRALAEIDGPPRPHS